MENNDVIKIAFSLYDKNGEYSAYVGCTMNSVLCNTKSRLEFYLLHDKTLSSSNKEKFESLCKIHNASIKFYNVILPHEMKACKGITFYSFASLYRLFIAELLQDVDKIIYLDSDIICCLDIRELWDKNLGGGH